MARLLNSFPPEKIKKTILAAGGAFRKKHEYRNEGEKSRYFFILNRFPEKDDRLIIVTATTKIQQRKKHRLPQVLVEIKPKDYPSLEEHSIIDCESAVIWNRAKFEEQINKGEVEPLATLPDFILEKLRTAISFSRILAPIDKRLVLGEDAT
jgi:hypothetical protein